MSVCITYLPWYAFGGQRTSCGSWFSPSTRWIPGIELKSCGFVQAPLSTGASLWPQ